MDLIWMFSGTLVYFIYQFKILHYASRILDEPYNNSALYILFATINSIFLIIFYAVNIPHYLFYLIAFFVLGIEFLLISKSKPLQAFTGSIIFILNISLIHIPTSIIYSHISGFFPLYTVQDTAHRSITLLISCAVLLIILFLIEALIPANDIKRITMADKYTAILFITSFMIVIFLTVEAALLISTEIYPQQLYISLFLSIIFALIFYYVFIYNILLINASLYKRYSDTAREERDRIKDTQRKISDKIDKDSLTGIYSRRYIISTLESLCKTPNSVFSILFVDVNGLKKTNDTFGHEAGDRLIVKIGQAITKSIRYDDFAARIGGDEFLIVLNDTNEEINTLVTNRILENISIENETEDFLISASIGVLLVDEESKQGGVNLLLSKADDLMRKQKQGFYNKDYFKGEL